MRQIQLHYDASIQLFDNLTWH